MALVSARQTINSLEVLSILMASYLYILCQALDLRAMQKELNTGVYRIASEEVANTLGKLMTQSDLASLTAKMCTTLGDSLDATTTMDTEERMTKVAASTTTTLLDFLISQASSVQGQVVGTALQSIPSIRERIAQRSRELITQLRSEYLSGGRGRAPASQYLNRTKPLYEFVRLKLGIKMHGSENFKRFANGHGYDQQTIGQDVSLIHEAIRDGKMQSVVVSMFSR
jgi:phenylalanine ammonia-lyase